GLLELGERRLSHGVQRFSGRIRHQMQIEAGHGDLFLAPLFLGRIMRIMWITGGPPEGPRSGHNLSDRSTPCHTQAQKLSVENGGKHHYGTIGVTRSLVINVIHPFHRGEIAAEHKVIPTGGKKCYPSPVRAPEMVAHLWIKRNSRYPQEQLTTSSLFIYKNIEEEKVIR